MFWNMKWPITIDFLENGATVKKIFTIINCSNKINLIYWITLLIMECIRKFILAQSAGAVDNTDCFPHPNECPGYCYI